MWAVTEQMLGTGIDALRPAAAWHHCDAAMARVLGAHYRPDEIAGMVRFRNGHGLGLSYEEPLTTDAFPQHFDPSATSAASPAEFAALAMPTLLELHPNLFIPGLGGAALGEMVLVGSDGFERLLQAPTELQNWS